ncbi:peptidoglycan recognition family protein [Brucella sp. TWI432]
MSLVLAQWMPAVPMKRIICHWTAGTHTANATDKKAYHILIQGDGSVIRGDASIASNSGSIKDGYAAHTLNCNTDSIGVSMCAMAGSVESPFNPGKYPITATQWESFIKVTAELAAFYKIPVTPKTVLFHAEVQANLGITQRNKWDVTRLVFDKKTGAAAIGALMRSDLTLAMSEKVEPALEPFPKGAIVAANKEVPTSSTKAGAPTGKLPKGTNVEVLLADGARVQIETPAGYSVWANRADLDLIDGPKTEVDAVPNPMRDMAKKLRDLADEMEATIK